MALFLPEQTTSHGPKCQFLILQLSGKLVETKGLSTP
jgi:hypothetical protein